LLNFTFYLYHIFIENALFSACFSKL